MDSLEAQAAALGIPMRITVNDDLRYVDCDAHSAMLVAVHGTEATYQGECNVGHHYEMRFQVDELKKMAHIENGEIVYGSAKSFVADGLEEF